MTNIELLKTIRDALIAAVEVMENRLDDCDQNEPDEAPDTPCPVDLMEAYKQNRLGCRATNCLLRVGVHTLNEAVERFKTPEELMKVRNLGRRSMDELIAFSHKCGMRWAWEVEE